jgi:hypothetical protein
MSHQYRYLIRWSFMTDELPNNGEPRLVDDEWKDVERWAEQLKAQEIWSLGTRTTDLSVRCCNRKCGMDDDPNCPRCPKFNKEETDDG